MSDALLSSYMFDLPPELIAQHPAAKRDASRLMLLGPDGTTERHIFADLPELLRAGDILVRNNVRVLPARLIGKRAGGGGAELLLVRREKRGDGEAWLCLARPANRFGEGRDFSFGPNGRLVASALERGEQGMVWVRFSLDGDAFLSALEQYGQVPLPPYIERADKQPTQEDAERYQTTFAKHPGAVAAPTAGLHFTRELDRRLAERGVRIVELTLNVGPGTFRPIKEERLDNHRMDYEWYSIPEETWAALQETRRRGGRIVAVGTTSVRSLESAARANGALSGWTDLFIRPGHQFRMVDGLVTNFHLPGSSLMVLISALAGRKRILAAYEQAIADHFRFYSYGDAMLIWPHLEGATFHA
jgi:S-adenosylmethionine:tRNA ribosyltransferase-isomerase